MRIAFVTQPGHAVIPAAGSVEIWTDEVARRLAGEHSVTIFATATPRTADCTREGVDYRFIEHLALDGSIGRIGRVLFRASTSRRPYFASVLHPLAYWVGVGRALRRGNYDVVHVANYSQAIPILRRLAPRTRVVLHMHCEWLTQLSKPLIRRRLRRAAAVLGCSDHLTGQVRARFPQLAERCHTVANGIDVAALDVEREPERAPERLLFVGRISPEKGLHVLMDSFSTLQAERPELELVLVGEEEAPDPGMLIRLSNDERVRDLEGFYSGRYSDALRARLTPEARARVEFAGVVPYERVAEHYRNADVFVLPSFMEAFGMPLAEAQASGLPVVGSRTGGIPYIVEDGVTGLLVEPGDGAGLTAALRRLFEDAGLRTSLAAAGRDRARERFGWDTIAARLVWHLGGSSSAHSGTQTLSVRLGET
jgi:glycosyltransferase involved in cell wall biosynthesis